MDALKMEAAAGDIKAVAAALAYLARLASESDGILDHRRTGYLLDLLADTLDRAAAQIGGE